MAAHCTTKSCVSTHSRPKAAGKPPHNFQPTKPSFNTQPPEGGWPQKLSNSSLHPNCFNTQPPEGGWMTKDDDLEAKKSFNTQPPEGGWPTVNIKLTVEISFNTQPPEGGWAA